MPASKRGKERERFYLFPGMGGRSARRKHNFILRWSLFAALIVCVIFGVILFLVNREF